MKLYYDFHIHSGLSPCGDNEMTPNNIVNMAKLYDLDVIALTDHNSTLNCRAVMEAGKEIGLLVIPGMELCTSEEIHCVCLFPGLQNALSFSEFVKTKIPPVKNKEKIFGRQLIMDHEDKVLGSFELLLTTAANISIEELSGLMKDYGGVWYPAHIDRSSYSLISSLGDFPKSLETPCFELTYGGDEKLFKEKYDATGGKLLLRSSDAHYLENMVEASCEIDIPECTPQAVVDYILNK